MSISRLTHITAVLGIAASQLQFVWLDPGADLANKSCTTIVTLLTLIFTDPAHHSLARTVVGTFAALAALVATHLLTTGTLGTSAAALLTTAAAVFARLPAALSRAPEAPAPAPAEPGPGTGGPGPGTGGPGAGSGEAAA